MEQRLSAVSLFDYSKNLKVKFEIMIYNGAVFFFRLHLKAAVSSAFIQFSYPSLLINLDSVAISSLFSLSGAGLKQHCSSVGAFIKMTRTATGTEHAHFSSDRRFNDCLDMMNCSLAVGRGTRSYPSICGILA